MTKVPLFKVDNLVHHSKYMKLCGEVFDASTTNMAYVTCPKCLELIEQKKSKPRKKRPDADQ
jgi:hypothetical protein